MGAVKVYNKLVRDNIPRIITEEGHTVIFCELHVRELEHQLVEKLQEETSEYIRSRSAEELADILEVVYAIAETKGLTIENMEAIRKDKALRKGAFKNRIFLESVQENYGEDILSE